MHVFQQGDRLHHFFWKEEEYNSEFKDVIADYYIKVDRYLKEIIKTADDNTIIFIINIK